MEYLENFRMHSLGMWLCMSWVVFLEVTRRLNQPVEWHFMHSKTPYGYGLFVKGILYAVMGGFKNFRRGRFTPKREEKLHRAVLETTPRGKRSHTSSIDDFSPVGRMGSFEAGSGFCRRWKPHFVGHRNFRDSSGARPQPRNFAGCLRSFLQAAFKRWPREAVIS